MAFEIVGLGVLHLMTFGRTPPETRLSPENMGSWKYEATGIEGLGNIGSMRTKNPV